MTSGAADIRFHGTIHETLGIRPVELAPGRVTLEMEVGPKVHQPFGLLHGGASAVLAESAASLGAYLTAGPETHRALGIELNISHLKAMTSGTLSALATPVRTGRTIHVWRVELTDQDGEAVATARCTLAIREVP